MKEYYICTALDLGSYVAGKTYKIATIAKKNLRMLVLVRSLQSLDNMIGLGVQPSQLRLPHEEW